jgi:hypothetical protein
MTLTVELASNPVYSNEEETSIYLTVKFKEFGSAIPYRVSTESTETFDIDLYNNAKEGVYGNILPYPLAPKTESTSLE